MIPDRLRFVLSTSVEGVLLAPLPLKSCRQAAIKINTNSACVYIKQVRSVVVGGPRIDLMSAIKAIWSGIYWNFTRAYEHEGVLRRRLNKARGKGVRRRAKWSIFDRQVLFMLGESDFNKNVNIAPFKAFAWRRGSAHTFRWRRARLMALQGSQEKNFSFFFPLGSVELI